MFTRLNTLMRNAGEKADQSWLIKLIRGVGSKYRVYVFDLIVSGFLWNVIRESLNSYAEITWCNAFQSLQKVDLKKLMIGLPNLNCFFALGKMYEVGSWDESEIPQL